jgi:SAM-dependent methyltransferase
MANQDRIDFYSENAPALASQYDGLDREKVHHSILYLFESKTPLRILDVGCGSGADARWLATKYGHQVTAVEPSDLFNHAVTANAHPNVTYLRDSLPDLKAVRETGRQFDLVLGIAVLQELDAADRAASIKTLVGLTKPGGEIVFMYPSPPSREGQKQIKDNEVADLLGEIGQDSASKQTGQIEFSSFSPDTKGRKAITGEPLTFQERIIRVAAKDPARGVEENGAVVRAWSGVSADWTVVHRETLQGAGRER